MALLGTPPGTVQGREPVQAGPWPDGMNNRQVDHALPPGALRNAVNADVDNLGTLRRRAGYARIHAGVNTRGGFSCPVGTFFVEGGNLCRLNADDSVTVLCGGIYGETITYEHVNGAVYFSDGLVTKRITTAGAGEWGLGVPAAPTLAQVSGALPAGTYLAAVTVIDADGRESGASETTRITTSTASGLRIAGLPSGKTVRLYLGSTNGTVLYMVAETTAAYFDVVLPGFDSGKPLDTQFLTKPPAGRIIRHHYGRLYIADAYGAVWYTEPYSYDLIHPGRNFFQFAEPASVMESVTGGLWIVSDQTEFFAGTGPDDFRASTKLGYGAVYGTGQIDQRNQNAIWYSTRGVVVGEQDGQATNLQEKNVAPDSGTVGAALVREQDGLRQMVVSVRDPNVSPLAATSFLEMEVIRKAAQ